MCQIWNENITHDTAGGCAHSFERYSSASSRDAFVFDSGPSLLSGMSGSDGSGSDGSTNPLRQVLDAIGSKVEWKQYDGWIFHDYADGKKTKLTTGDGGAWEKAIEEKAGIEARKCFESFRDAMLEPGGLTESSAYVPPFVLRGGPGAVLSLGPTYLAKLASIGVKGTLLTGPFTECMDLYGVHDAFVRKWFDYLSFALSGLDAAHTQAAPVAYTMGDLHKRGALLDYPMGGMGALVDALVDGLERHGGTLRVKRRVESFVLEEEGNGARCRGVILTDGTTIRARKGVVSNVPLWNMARLLKDSVDSTTATTTTGAIGRAVQKIVQQADKMEMTGSFMHLHLGIPADGLPEDLECHHSVMDLSKDTTGEQNLVIISIPTVFDPSLAPKGYHIVHAYTAANDNFQDWLPFLQNEQEQQHDDDDDDDEDNNSFGRNVYARKDGYKEFKDKKARALWKAIEQVIPDIRERAERPGAIQLVASPLTHRRYVSRAGGTFGPAPPEGKDIWELSSALTPIKGLLACGDTCFPGIGLPGVAASGTIAANTLASIPAHLDLIRTLRKDGVLQ
eukprot:CAMPEP_0118719052 /NCGR_PEP_ID=MMETSP0800-20121206/29192_1 /TAXON_ID=210618 ORGANISM="Striatella unipunctata, Strain CCMP2910" /NCGR_SAMPLE_ID=MMETSP0800 /ASSEMBLY_ACC=CAM_ASM_000638 /LENGTH=563 /DNA_ID=CAMNT_0006626241 /DNA_START=119 /DNA_END=1810 /DNA_ORIENTATION=+